MPNTTVSLREDIKGGLTFAAAFSVLALLIIVALGVSTLLGAQVKGWAMMPIGLPAIIASYFAGGLLGGVAFWLTRPLRQWLLGWVITGIVVGTLAYGSIGFTGVLTYVLFDVNLFDFQSRAEAWGIWPLVSVACGTLTGIPLGLYYWSQEHSSGPSRPNWRFVIGVIVVGAILAFAMWLAGWW